MAKFTVVATAVEQDGRWGVLYEMEQGEMTANEFTVTNCRDMAEARSNLFNRQRQHGLAGLGQIGEQYVPNMFVKLF